MKIILSGPCFYCTERYGFITYETFYLMILKSIGGNIPYVTYFPYKNKTILSNRTKIFIFFIVKN